jgi:hypothetical protein
VGRQIDEGDICFTNITFHDYEQILKKGKKFPNGEDEELLKRIIQIGKK